MFDKHVIANKTEIKDIMYFGGFLGLIHAHSTSSGHMFSVENVWRYMIGWGIGCTFPISVPMIIAYRRFKENNK
jgi:hypothetical protein